MDRDEGRSRRPLRVLVLGAGFGGLELATRLSEELGHDVDIVLVDRTDDFVFGFSKLDVMFGRRLPQQVRHRYADLATPGVQFVSADVTAVDPGARRVETSAGIFEADVLVIALGADLDPAATPGLVEGGHEFYTEAGAFALRDVLAEFGGGRVVIGVTSTPYKCPPAPSEAALLMDEYLTQRGLRDHSEITLVLPLPTPVPPSSAASAALVTAFTERGINFRPERSVRMLDPARRVVVLDDGDGLPYDLFLGVPVHRAPEVVERCGLAVDGWIPVDPLTLETSWPGVYAVGDVTSVGTPKAGVFAEGQAAVVADAIIANTRGGSPAATYDGRGVCYVEFGGAQVAMVDVTFRSGQRPTGTMQGPSEDLAAEKAEFGQSRVQRWFGHPWGMP
ncbi:MAG: NAD(P)/FAD-dependent oxidoreductase [Nocardioides sp.]|nr:NAD(P)/FAD-dependent oxidoreductase [Nocardioides sp.]